jgi:hypothetical protein
MNCLNRSGRPARGLAALAGAAAFALVAAGCANAAPYNPAHLEQAKLQAVDGVCQSVMGLSADEPPVPGDGNPRLDPLENHYQGCVAALSHALEREGRVLTLLRGADRAYAPARLEIAASAAAATIPFFGLTPRQWRQRTERACASIGLDPAAGGFDACVKDMTDTFYAIDNPWY